MRGGQAWAGSPAPAELMSEWRKCCWGRGLGLDSQVPHYPSLCSISAAASGRVGAPGLGTPGLGLKPAAASEASDTLPASTGPGSPHWENRNSNDTSASHPAILVTADKWYCLPASDLSSDFPTDLKETLCYSWDNKPTAPPPLLHTFPLFVKFPQCLYILFVLKRSLAEPEEKVPGSSVFLEPPCWLPPRGLAFFQFPI